MTFLNPWGLLGLLSIPVIVGLHLHLERNRRVVVSSMFLWTFLEAKFEGQKPRYVQLSWLLLLDILVAVFLSMAFAKPVVKLPAVGGIPVQRIILLDDSMSMQAKEGDSDRFSMAKEIVFDLLTDGNPRDESILITFGGRTKLVGKSIEQGVEGLIRSLEGLEAVSTGTDLRAGVSLGLNLANNDLPVEITILTDAAFDAVELQDFPEGVEWILVGVESNNQAVIDPVLETRGSKPDLFFRVVNYSSNQVERELVIRTDQTIVYQQVVVIPPTSVQAQVITISGDPEVVEIQLNGKDALPLDDSAVLSNRLSPPVRVALVSDDPAPIDRAIAGVPGAELTIINPLDYTASLNYDLVLFRGVIPDRWPAGLVIVFDPPQGNQEVKVNGLELVTSPITILPHEILNGVELAGVRWEYVWTVEEGTPGRRLIQAAEKPFLLQQQVNDTDLFIFLPMLSSGNFIKHPAFPIFLANAVEYSRHNAPRFGYSLGESLELGELLHRNEVRIQTPGSESGIPLENSALLLDEVGLYTLMAAGSFAVDEYNFSVIAGEFEESNIRPREWAAVVNSGETPASPGFQMVEVNLGPWLLLLAVVVLVVEAWRAWR